MKGISSISRYRKWIICLSFIFCYIPDVFSQRITNYNFLASSGTFTPLVSGTTNQGQGSSDDGAWNTNAIGFDFWYMGTRYTTISASTNGWLAFGTTISSYGFVNSLSSTATANATTIRPIIAPLWDDLSVPSTSSFSYQTSGTAGSRVFTAEYLNVEWQYAATSACISFQVKLYEGTGKVEFIYRSESGTLSTPSASIGITGNATGAYLSLNGTGTNPTASSATETSNLNTRPASGQTYTFTPSVPADPSDLSFSAVTSSSMRLNWTDNSSDEIGFLIYRSSDNGQTYEFLTQTAANDVSSTQSGLLSSFTYLWKVYAVSEGALSVNSVNGSQATNTCGSTVTARTWVGAGNGGTGTEFNKNTNWNPVGIPTCADSLNMTLTSAATISLSSSIEVGAISASISGSNNIFQLNTGAFILQINQTAAFSVPSGNGNTKMQVNVANGGTLIYNKSVTFSAASGANFPIYGSGGTTGTIKFKGNVTFNSGCKSAAADQPGTVIFDANGTQTITCNNTGYSVYLGTITTEIGSQNNPTVILAGTANGTPYGNLTINGTSTLDLSTKTFNRYASGGSINMSDGSTLKLAAGAGGQTGSNFPSNFTTFAFNANSTVIYNSSNGLNQTIYAVRYGNLILTNSAGVGSSTKTAGGNLTILGNFSINDAYTIFDAGASLNHSLQGNWINNGALNSGSFTYTTANTITFNGTSAQQIQGGAATTFYNLSLSNSSGLTLAPGAGLITTAKNTLTLTSGKVILGNFDLAIGATAFSGTISGYSSSNYIITNGTGTLNQFNIGTGQRTSVIYPIGISSSSYTPITLNIVGTTTVDNYKIVVSQDVYSSGTTGSVYTSGVVNRTWHVTEGVSGGSNVTLTAQWNATDELTGFDRTNCFINHYSSEWGSTSERGNASADLPYTRVSGTLTSFSPFTVATTGSALPIELISFSGRCDGSNVLLEWKTTSETNNDYFTIERSTDTRFFEPVGKVTGMGNSSTIKQYSFTDVAMGAAYYRLKQTNYNGNYEYVDIISVTECTDIHETEIINTYNDSGTLTLNIYSDIDQKYEIIIYEITGRKVLSSQHYLLKNTNEIKLNSTGINSGVYVVMLKNEKTMTSQKIVM